MPHAYPLMLDVADRRIVIVGGGAVAVRKAKGLLECGATHVTCVAPTIDANMPTGVKKIHSAYHAEHLNGASLAFAATNDSEVNAAVVRDARARNILVNRADADAAEPGDFSTPARCADGGVVVSVSASGNPALAAHIRDQIKKGWNSSWSRMSEAMSTLRPEIVSSHASPHVRSQALRSLATDEAMNVLTAGDVDALRNWVRARYPELALHHG